MECLIFSWIKRIKVLQSISNRGKHLDTGAQKSLFCIFQKFVGILWSRIVPIDSNYFQTQFGLKYMLKQKQRDAYLVLSWFSQYGSGLKKKLHLQMGCKPMREGKEQTGSGKLVANATVDISNQQIWALIYLGIMFFPSVSVLFLPIFATKLAVTYYPTP